MAYRFAGEVVDIDELLKQGSEAPKPNFWGPTEKKPSGEDGRPAGVKIDPISGEAEGIDDAGAKF